MPRFLQENWVPLLFVVGMLVMHLGHGRHGGHGGHGRRQAEPATDAGTAAAPDRHGEHTEREAGHEPDPSVDAPRASAAVGTTATTRREQPL